MRNFVARLVWLCIFYSFFLTGCTSTEPVESIPPPYNPDNPLLAKVGDFSIDKEYFDTCIQMLPGEYFEKYADPTHNREFLNDLIVQEIFYQDGFLKKHQNEKPYINQEDQAKWEALMEYALEKHVRKNNPITEQQLKARYDENPEKYSRPDGSIRSFENARLLVKKEMLKQRMKEQMALIGPSLEERFSVRYYMDRLKNENEETNKPVVESGIVTWSPADFKLKATEAGLQDQLVTYEGKVSALKQIVNEMLFHDNAVADQINKEPEFQKRLKAIKHLYLSQYTQTLIIGNDVTATMNEARAYVDLHPEEFSGKKESPGFFSEVREEALVKATEYKRKKVLAELAKALARDRFKVVLFSENCDRIWGTDS